jgi:transcriptional regulator with XRE-family HTH domain
MACGYWSAVGWAASTSQGESQMISTRHGTARIRSLAGELKDLRDQAGLNTREAAAKVGMSASTLNRLENGSRTIDPEEVSALLVAYGVTGVERERLLSLAREVNLPGWWETSGSGGLPKHLPALIGFEAEATMIVHVSMLLVPGLLQTADYIRGVMSGMGVRGPDLETRVATRLGRQAVLTRPQPPQYLAILDEAVLRRPVDGAHIMADQLRHIIECAQKPHVDVRVLPFSRGTHRLGWHIHRAGIRQGTHHRLPGTQAIVAVRGRAR